MDGVSDASVTFTKLGTNRDFKEGYDMMAGGEIFMHQAPSKHQNQNWKQTNRRFMHA